MSENDQAKTPAQVAANRPLFDLIRVYAKDSSLETPHSPIVFQSQWKPELQVKFDTKTTKIAEDQFEVTLRITVTCNNEGKTAFICEVTQAGVFLLRNIPTDAGEFLLGGTAPNILFPYAREFISSLVSRATFPQLNLAPINFEALFRARKAQQEAQAQQNAGTKEKDKEEKNKARANQASATPAEKESNEKSKK